MSNHGHHRFNAAQILKLVRDGQATTIDELKELLIPRKLSAALRSRRYHEVRSLLTGLIEAGLVKATTEGLSATALTDKVQSALDISLTELSEAGPNSVVISPTFRSSRSQNPIPDIFVLMPFLTKLAPVYEDHIKNVAQELNMSVGRADDFFAAETIVSDIWRAIFNSRIIIADCTGRNPNVFYEIGIAHTIGRPTILISPDIDDVPFDLRHWRSIIYEYTPRGMAAFNDALRKTIKTEREKRSL